HLNDEIGPYFREQALGPTLAAPQNRVAFRADHDIELAAPRQLRERVAIEENRVLVDVKAKARVGLRVGKQDRCDARQLLGGARGDDLAGRVEKAPMALLRRLRGKRRARRWRGLEAGGNALKRC